MGGKQQQNGLLLLVRIHTLADCFPDGCFWRQLVQVHRDTGVLVWEIGARLTDPLAVVWYPFAGCSIRLLYRTARTVAVTDRGLAVAFRVSAGCLQSCSFSTRLLCGGSFTWTLRCTP
jgi:hypothetical protein